jgi:coenzyme PQQ synthesis protein D (PqqD)
MNTTEGVLPTPSDDVLATELPDGESVLLDLKTEAYFGLNELGTAVWAALTGGSNLDRIAEETSAATETPVATVRADIETLLGDLRSRGLVVGA